MDLNIQQMINSYAEWIKSEISVEKYGEYYELTTPYLDRFNDYLQIYVKQDEDGTITMSDDGYIIGNLISSGVSFSNSPKRKEMLQKIARKYSVTFNDEEIMITANEGNFPIKKHLLIQAMIDVDDMFVLAQDNVKDFFAEDVATYFDAHNIMYSRDLSLIGKTGTAHTYDFFIQRTKNRNEIFCKTINNLKESSRNLTIFNWIDAKGIRQTESDLWVIINDENRLKKEDTQAFEQYGILAMPYSKRNEYVQRLLT